MRFLFPTLRHERSFLTPCAQHSRRHPTLSERILWEALRGRRLGVEFRRQVILANTIVDFFAPASPWHATYTNARSFLLSRFT